MNKSTSERLQDWKQKVIQINNKNSLSQNVKLIVDNSSNCKDSLAEKLYSYFNPFSEDFESWIELNLFDKIFEENFETDWFIDNTFNSIFTENFEGVWE